MKIASSARLSAAWDYLAGTFKIRRMMLIGLVALSLMFTSPVFFHFPALVRKDLVYLYVSVVYVTGLFEYGTFRRPIKSLLGSLLLGSKQKPRELTPEEYEGFSVRRILDEMGIKSRVRIFVTTNRWIEGPFTNAITNNVYLPASWMKDYPRQDMRGVLGHELAHIAKKWTFNRDVIVCIGGVIVLSYLFGRYTISVVVSVFEFALALLVLTVISRRNEIRADLEGARVTGPEGLISVFEQLLTESKRDDGSETHPPLKERIARLSTLLGAIEG